MRRFTAILLGTCGCLTALPAFAQDTSSQLPAAPASPSVPSAEAADSGDIVVTAQRRSERVQDVPIAISVVSGAQLDRQQVTQLSDLSRTTASLQINSSGGGGGGGGAYIRGIGTAALTRSAESAVGVVVDGVVQGNTNISNLFDIARVEVLRGPQGTLFGQSVSAGVINITTEAPDPSKVSGKITSQLAFDGFAGSEFGRQVLRGGVNVPVSETSAVRVSAFGSRTNGITSNSYTGKKDELQEVGWRARYRGEFGRVTANIIGDYNYTNGKDGQFFELTAVEGPQNAQLATLCGIEAKLENLQHCSGGREAQTSRAYGLSGQFDVDLGPVTLTSITSRRLQNLFVTGDIDRMPDPLVFLNVQSGSRTDYGQFTQELRLASDATRPLSATIGAFYLDSDTTLNSGPQNGQRTVIAQNLIIGTNENSNTQIRNYSGFGEARYHTGIVTVFAGGRITKAEITQDGTYQGVSPATGPIFSSDLKFEDTDFSWRAGAQLEPIRNIMLYGTAARGYKNGQIAPISIINGSPVLGSVVLPEKPMAYEAGLKTSLFNGRLSVNVDGFYQKVRNFQTQTAFRDPTTQVISLRPINIDRLVTKGIEGDAFGRIGRNLTINASAIYNIAKYPAGFLARDGSLLAGQQITYAPRFAGTISGEYSRELSGNLQGFVSLDGSYRSKTRLSDERIESALTVDKQHFTFGGRLGVRVNDAWTLAAFATNIGASRLAGSKAGLAAQPGSAYAFATSYGPQSVRQIGLQGQLEF